MAVPIEAESMLVGRLRGGDTAALETLMGSYASRVHRLAHGITRNREDSEEVAQDVFLTLFRKIWTFEGRAMLGSWIYRVTANAALIKRRRKRSDVEVPLEAHLPAFRHDGRREGDRAWLEADWSRTPEEELLSIEMRTLLNRTIDDLPERYRTVVVLRDVEGLSNREVAQIVGESVASVKSRLHRGRMALREQLTAVAIRSSPPGRSSQ